MTSLSSALIMIEDLEEVENRGIENDEIEIADEEASFSFQRFFEGLTDFIADSWDTLLLITVVIAEVVATGALAAIGTALSAVMATALGPIIAAGLILVAIAGILVVSYNLYKMSQEEGFDYALGYNLIPITLALFDLGAVVKGLSGLNKGKVVVEGVVDDLDNGPKSTIDDLETPEVKPKYQSMIVEEKKLTELPNKVQESYNNYTSPSKKDPSNSWKSGKAPAGARSERPYENKFDILPTNDTNGKPIKYMEYDVNSKTSSTRDAERFVIGSDDSRYYTSTHYGDAGDPAFYKITE